MTPRSPGLPGTLVTAEYPSNDSTVKPPRVLPGAMATCHCELRDGRVFVGHRIGESRWAETSFSPQEFRALAPQLRAVFAAIKETP